MALTPEEKERKEECESKIAKLRKENKRTIGGRIRRERAGEELGEFPRKRFFENDREIESCKKQLEQLMMKARGNESIHTTAEGIGVTVVRDYRLVYIRGDRFQLQSHVRTIEQDEELSILEIKPSTVSKMYMDNNGRRCDCRLITFKDYEGLEKYLTFLGV